jgi:hypothetical protein
VKTTLAKTLCLILLLTAAAGTQFVAMGEAFPPYQSNAESLITIFVSSPENNKLYNTNILKLNFNVTVGETTSSSLISNVCYETDWQKENNTIFSFDGYFLRELMVQLSYPRTFTDPISKFSQIVKLTEIPEGNHSITIYTTMWHYSSIEKSQSVFEYYFDYHDLTMASRSATVFFAVDTVPPAITISSPKNMTYDTSDFPVNFTVNELFSKCSYSLDGQNNLTTTGNMTLAGLPNGEHNLTIYATDTAGNIGSSETMYFTVDVPEPFPTVPVAVASVAAAVVVGVGLLVYFRKHKR